MFRWWWLCPLLFLSACVTTGTAPTPAPPAATAPDPARVISTDCDEIASPSFITCQFYSRLVTMMPLGLPEPRVQELLAEFLTPALQAQVAQAWADREEGLPAWADDLPLWSSEDAPPDRFQVLSVRAFDAHWFLVRVALANQDLRRGWVDEVLVWRGPMGDRIDDLLFPRPGLPPERLTRRLAPDR